MIAKKPIFMILVCLALAGVAYFALPQTRTAARAADGYTVTVVTNGSPQQAYLPENRRWQAIASIEATGQRLWAAWMAGGVTEPDPDNHIIAAFSDDGGRTWVDPVLVIDDNGNKSTRLRDPVLWLDDAGVLWLFFGFQGGGTQAVTIARPQAPIESLQVSAPRRCFGQTILNKPIITASGEWICAVDPYIEAENYAVTHILSSTDRGASWVKKGEIRSEAAMKRYHEPTIVEKADGTLWCISRIEQGAGGGLEQSFSTDGGVTWSKYRANLPQPLIGPGSKCAMRKLRSGAFLFVTNASTGDRVDMTAYLSEDGERWSALRLDARSGCAYPDIAEAEDGTLYVIWDFGRRVQNEIRAARFTREDVAAGAFVTQTARNMITVAKDAAFSDVVLVKESFPRFVTYAVGEAVTAEAFIATLPQLVHVVTDKGEEYTLTGKWQTNWFSTAYEGVYTFTFVADRAMPEFVADNLGLLQVLVTVEKKPETTPKRGCGGAVSAGSGIAALLLTAATGTIAMRKKKHVR